jgi:hypothetical protein
LEIDNSIFSSLKTIRLRIKITLNTTIDSIKITLRKIANTASIKIVLTKIFVCCTVLGFPFTIVVKFTKCNIADKINAILQNVTILEKKRKWIIFICYGYKQ